MAGPVPAFRVYWRRVLAGLLILVLPAVAAQDRGPPRLVLAAVGLERLDGWAGDTVAAAVPAFLKSCARLAGRADAAAFDPALPVRRFGTVGEWRPVCEAATALPVGDETAARRFLERDFVPMLALDGDAPYGGAADIGLFTGYYEPELNGARRRHGRYTVPLYRRPSEPGLATRFTRAEIETGALAGKGLELVWVDDPVDAFFLQIQGSGRVRLAEGGAMRVGYDGQNGYPFVPIGRLLVERGIMRREQLTMAAIRGWLAAHPQAGAALMREDPSFVFFREIHGEGPIGAEQVVLTPQRSLTVDHSQVPLGVPLWVGAKARFPAAPDVVRLVVAQDTGGAIRGPVRGDFFWGTGRAAGDKAGATNARGRYYLLLPRAVAARLGG